MSTLLTGPDKEKAPVKRVDMAQVLTQLNKMANPTSWWTWGRP